MAQDAKVEFEGGPQFASDMQRLTHELEIRLDDTLVQVARGLVPRVVSVMPKVSGTLAGSVDVEQISLNEVDVIASTPYAPWIEFGGKNRPYIADGRYLLPTVGRAGNQVQQKLMQTAKNTIGGWPWSHTQT